MLAAVVLALVAFAAMSGEKKNTDAACRSGKIVFDPDFPQELRADMAAMMKDTNSDPESMYNVAAILDNMGYPQMAECVRTRADWLST